MLSAASSPPSYSSSSSDTTAHSNPCLPPSSPTVFLLSLSFLHPFLPREDKIADYFVPLPVPRVSSDAALYLPLLLILRTTRHLTTQTSVSLFRLCVSTSYPFLSPPLLFSSRPSCLDPSRFYPYLVHDPAPTCSIVRLPRAFTSRNARSSLRRAYYTDGVYAEYYACSDSLTRRCRMNVPPCDPIVNHLVRLLHRDFLQFRHTISPLRN